MSTQPAPSDPPNMSPKGKWGVAASSSPQVTRAPGNRNRSPALWWALAALIVVIIVLVIVFA